MSKRSGHTTSTRCRLVMAQSWIMYDPSMSIVVSGLVTVPSAPTTAQVSHGADRIP